MKGKGFRVMILRMCEEVQAGIGSAVSYAITPITGFHKFQMKLLKSTLYVGWAELKTKRLQVTYFIHTTGRVWERGHT